MKKRVYWVDALKFICIMMIMYSHTDFDTYIAKQFYYHFYLFGFFFASGYVYKNKDRFNIFIYKKAKSLMIPWLTFGLLNIVLSQVLTFNSHNSIKDELVWMLLQIRGLNDKMWFLAALFMAFIPFYFIIKFYEEHHLKNIKLMLIIACFALSLISNIYTVYMNPEIFPWKTNALPWHIEYIFVAMFWMFAGYLFKDFEKNYDDKISDSIKVGCIALYVFLGTVLPCVGIFDYRDSILTIGYKYLLTILALVGLIYICKLMKPNKYVSYIGQNTLICFGIHGKTFSVMQMVLRKMFPTIYSFILGSQLYSILFGILFTIVLSIVLLLPIYVINRWLPFMLGKPLKK